MGFFDWLGKKTEPKRTESDETRIQNSLPTDNLGYFILYRLDGTHIRIKPVLDKVNHQTYYTIYNGWKQEIQHIEHYLLLNEGLPKECALPMQLALDIYMPIKAEDLYAKKEDIANILLSQNAIKTILNDNYGFTGVLTRDGGIYIDRSILETIVGEHLSKTSSFAAYKQRILKGSEIARRETYISNQR